MDKQFKNGDISHQRSGQYGSEIRDLVWWDGKWYRLNPTAYTWKPYTDTFHGHFHFARSRNIITIGGVQYTWKWGTARRLQPFTLLPDETIKPATFHPGDCVVVSLDEETK